MKDKLIQLKQLLSEELISQSAYDDVYCPRVFGHRIRLKL